MSFNFISSDKRKRHRFIDRSIEAAYGVLSHEQTVMHLGMSALKYRHYLSNLYVPNQRYGEMILKRANDDLMPIIALQPGESIVLPPEMELPNQAQRAHITTALRDTLPGGSAWTDSATDQVVSHLSGQAGPQLLRMDDSMLAFVRRIENPVTLRTADGQAERRYISGRSMVAVMYPNGSRIDPSAIVHELEHVSQCDSTPVQQYRSRDEKRMQLLRDELVAYHVQSLAVNSMVAMGYQRETTEKNLYSINDDGSVHSPRLHGIEAVRRRINANAEDEFTPSDELIDELERRGVNLF